MLSIDNATPRYFSPIGILYEGDIYLKVEGDYANAYFSYSFDGKKYLPIGNILDVSILSDEYAYPMGFTGAYVGVAAQDLKFYKKEATFSNIIYIGKDRGGN